MIIAFWSTHHGQSATTTNMLSVGLCAAFQYKLRVLMTSAQSNDSHLRDYLLPEYKRDTSVSPRNSNDLMRLARNGLLQAQSISNYTTPILKASLLDVLSGMSLEEKSENEIDVFKAILEMSKSTYDVVLLDVHSGLNKHYVESILKFSDIVVVNISQNIELIDSVRAVQADLANDIKESLFICIGNYESDLKLNVRQISKLLSTESVIAIPRYAPIVDMMNTGNMLEFFGRHYYRGKLDKKQTFFNVVNKSTHMLLRSKQLVE